MSERFHLPILVSAVLPRDDDFSDLVDGFNIQMAAACGKVKDILFFDLGCQHLVMVMGML